MAIVLRGQGDSQIAMGLDPVAGTYRVRPRTVIEEAGRHNAAALVDAGEVLSHDGQQPPVGVGVSLAEVHRGIDRLGNRLDVLDEGTLPRRDEVPRRLLEDEGRAARGR